MKQRMSIAPAHGKPARAAFALLAAGMAFSACDTNQGGQTEGRQRPPRIAESGVHAASTAKAESSAHKAAGGMTAASAGSKTAEAKAPQTAKELLLSAATAKVWEIRERINATPEQDLHVTVTFSVGAAGRPVTVMGATASTSRGGASRDVADILALDPSGVSMAPSGTKRQATESVIIKGE